MFRFEYDEIVAFHPYETYQPAANGGSLLVLIDGINSSKEVREYISGFFRALLEEAKESKIRAFDDNKCGFTVRLHSWGKTTYYQLRFKDGNLSHWAMPGPPEAGHMAGSAEKEGT